MAAAVLLAANLKFDGSLILQIQGKGSLKMLVTEATSAQTCRATARWDEHTRIDERAGLRDLLGADGLFVMTLQPHSGEPWQGMVALEGDSIARMLMHYMARSEQLDTHISLAATDACAGGLLLQKLPEQNMGTETWEHMAALVQTVSTDELTSLDARVLLYRLFHQTPPRVFAPQGIEFACNCSRDKVGDMLLLLGAQEVGEAVAEQGSIEINCDFCHEHHVFDETDINSLFGRDITTQVLSAMPKKRNH